MVARKAEVSILQFLEYALILLTADDASNLVSWQSAFWPIMACTLAVMLQNTGRVCGGHYNDNHALKSSPVVCLFDTIFVLVEFIWLLVVGCSVQVAAKHVWYNRFEDGGIQSDDLYEFTHGFLVSGYNSVLTLLELPKTKTQHDTDHGPGSPSVDGDGRSPPIPLETIVTPSLSLEDPIPGPSTSIEPIITETVEPSNHEIGSPDVSSASADAGTSHSAEHTDLEAGLSQETSPLLKPLPGSTIDRNWRLGMAAFILGALPQAIKVFGMSGIPITQTLVAVLLANFLVPEIFRVAAGTAGAVELYPMPIVVNVKKRITTYHTYGLLFALVWTCLFDVESYLMAMTSMPLRTLVVVTAPPNLAFCGICIVACVWHAAPSCTLPIPVASFKPSGKFFRRREPVVVEIDDHFCQSFSIGCDTRGTIPLVGILLHDFLGYVDGGIRVCCATQSHLASGPSWSHILHGSHISRSSVFILRIDASRTVSYALHRLIVEWSAQVVRTGG